MVITRTTNAREDWNVLIEEHGEKMRNKNEKILPKFCTTQYKITKTVKSRKVQSNCK